MSQKIYSTILLDENDCYLCDNKLPHRASFDKGLLTAMVKDEYISKEAGLLLPESIKWQAADITNSIQPTIGITIKEIDALTDILIISRSTKTCRGECKKFRLDKFKCILKTQQIEIWTRR